MVKLNHDRFGKLEKWILVYAYLKTVKKDLPEDWKGFDCNCDKGEEFYVHGKDCSDCFLKAEILANYFGDRITESPRQKVMVGWEPKYVSDSRYKSALANIGRAFHSLLRKGMIEKGWVLQVKWEYLATKIILTEKGKEKAKTLIINGSDNY